MASSMPASADQEPAPLSPLESLPMELLRLIVAQFCPHCCREPSLVIVSRADSFDYCWAKAVNALCRTSRRLCLAAQPVLYHAPDIRRPGRFLRTIVRYRPDLAAEVRCLPYQRHWVDGLRYGLSMRMRDLRLGTRMAIKMQMYIPRGTRFDPDRGPTRLAISELPSKILEYELELYYEILIGLLPSLETIGLRVYRQIGYNNCAVEAEYYNFGARFSPDLEIDPLALLPKLRSVVLQGNNHLGCFPLAVHGVVALLAAAPNLKELVLSNAAGVNPQILHDDTLKLLPVALQSLTKLSIAGFQLQKDGEEIQRPRYEYIRELVRHCPNLKAFSLHAVPWPNRLEMEDDHHLSPTQLLDALMSARQSLESLTLRLSTFLVATEDLQPHLQPLMSQFTVLTTLVLDEQAFCRHWLPQDGGGHKQDDATCVTAMLPPTVAWLGVRLHHHFHAYGDLVHLGDRVAAGQFESLRRLEVEYFFSYPEEADAVAPKAEAYRTGLQRVFEGTLVHVTVDTVEFL